MTNLADNPIYKKMLQGNRTPSRWAILLIWLGVASPAIPSAYYVANTSSFPAFVMIILLVFTFVLIILALATILATRLVAKQASDEGFMLVQISRMTAKEIVKGLNHGARYRLRFWQSLSAGLLGYILIFFAVLFGQGTTTIVTFAMVTMMVVVGGGILIFHHIGIWPLFVMAGVWSALRGSRYAASLAGGMVLVPLAYAFLFSFITYDIWALLDPSINPIPFPSISITGGFFIILAPIIVPMPAFMALEADCIRALNKRMVLS
jgi:hypothetical protein